MTTLLAGAATADITPPAGGMMDGYGVRLQPSQGAHDPLFARALVLDYGGGQACAIIGCDLLGMHASVTQRVRDRAERETGIPGRNVLLCATHNHAGPYGLRGGMFSRLDEALAGALVEKVAGAIAAAHASRRPATLKLGRAAVDTVSMNRRHPEWPVDNVLRVLLVDREDGRPVATLLNFACHGTVLSAANLLLSAEFPGAACRLLQQETGAPAVYLNGACANVNPTWIRQDFESVERVGQIIGGQALRVAGELRTLGPGQQAHNIRWDEFTEKRVPGRIVAPRLGVVQTEIELPLRAFAADEEYASGILELESQAAALGEATDERRAAMAQLTRAQNERWAAVWARRPSDGAQDRQPERGQQVAEVQAFSLGAGLAVLALPGEFFVETAAAIRSRCGIEDLFIACYANDYLGYVVPPEAFEQGGYEAGVTFCGPEAEGIIANASVAALQEAAGGH